MECIGNQSVIENLWDQKTHTFSDDMLKLVAVFTMLLDHAASGILEYYLQYVPLNDDVWELLYRINSDLRVIGRIAFPLFCFLLIHGFMHTHSRLKYVGNLLLFALLSELPFDFLFYDGIDFAHQNVFWTLLIGLLMIWALEAVNQTNIKMILKCAASLPVIAAGIKMSMVLNTDYAWTGVLLILGLYLFRKKKGLQCTIPFVVFFIARVFRNVELGYYSFGIQVIRETFKLYWSIVISAFMILRCNEKRYIRKGKYFFYAFYPVHISILYLIRVLFCTG